MTRRSLWSWFWGKPSVSQPPQAAPTEPTDAQIDAARADWRKTTRGQAALVGLVAGLTFCLTEFVGNQAAVNRLQIQLNTKGGLPAPRQWGWDPSVGIKDSDAILVVTTLVLVVASITIAVVVAPQVASGITLYDRVALAHWGRLASRLGCWSTGVAVGVSATRAFMSPALCLVLLLVTGPAIVLSIITVQRAHDQQAVGLERTDLERADQALGFMGEHGYTEDRQPKQLVGFLRLAGLVVGSAIASAAVVLLMNGVVWGPDGGPSLKSWLWRFVLLSLMAAFFGVFVIAPLSVCLRWWWQANARGRPLEAWAAVVVAATYCAGYLGMIGAISALGIFRGWIPTSLLFFAPLVIYAFAVSFAAATGRGPAAGAAWAARSSFTDAKRVAQTEIDRQAARR